MSLWKPVWRYPAGRDPAVSILVFVDVALKASRSSRGRHGGCSFNPCFGGCRSERMLEYALYPLWWSFQSFFSWMSLWKHTAPITIWEKTAFQSLFSWMSLWKTYLFIPYTITIQKFQSLFSWMSLWKDNLSVYEEPNNGVSILVFVDVALKGLLPRWNPCLLQCFNPCFGGCRSERII